MDRHCPRSCTTASMWTGGGSLTWLEIAHRCVKVEKARLCLELPIASFDWLIHIQFPSLYSTIAWCTNGINVLYLIMIHLSDLTMKVYFMVYVWITECRSFMIQLQVMFKPAWFMHGQHLGSPLHVNPCTIAQQTFYNDFTFTWAE